MSNISLRLPDSLHGQLKELAQRENTSVNHLISTAVAEKVASLLTVEYLEQRGAGATREGIEWALSQVPASEPESYDKRYSKAS
jgi:predicted transcriptional regulator